MGWRDLSQPSIRQRSPRPPPAPPLRGSRAGSAPTRGRRAAGSAPRTHTHPQPTTHPPVPTPTRSPDAYVRGDAQPSRGCWSRRSPNPLPPKVCPGPPLRPPSGGFKGCGEGWGVPPPPVSPPPRHAQSGIWVPTPRVGSSASQSSQASLSPVCQGSPVARRLGEERECGCSLGG